MSSERLSQIIDFACKERNHGSSYGDIRQALTTYDLSKESITYVMKKVEAFDRTRRIYTKNRNRALFKLFLGALLLLASVAVVYAVSARYISFLPAIGITAMVMILLGVLMIFLGTKEMRSLKPLFK